ncbi:MAG: hypothetical protein K6T80_05410 [Firmicutes bacterium]|nr:hypothetical protein [Bacillota bacterium]
MRKVLFLVTLLVFSLTLTTAAFAAQSESFVFYGDSQTGCVTDGYHGYSWNHSGPARQWNGATILKNVFLRYSHKPVNDGKFIIKRAGWSGERYYYLDDNGVKHYFHLDPARDYEVHQYRDENGTTQFWFEATGWK